VTEPVRHWLRLASALEAAEVVSGIRGAHEDVPPAGTELHQAIAGDVSTLQPPLSGLRLPFYVTGVSTYADPSDWSHTTLGAFIADVGLNHANWLNKLTGIFERGAGTVVSAFDQWPVIVKGTSEGNLMRWLKTTIKGTLGGVEEFQFSVNFGKPGDDPDPTQAEMNDLAVSLGAKFAASLGTADENLGGPSRLSLFMSDVVFRDCGVAKLQITDAPDVHGEGGNLAYIGETEWVFLNSTTGLAGSGSGKSLPYEVATAVSFHTEQRGPRGRGRCYLPPMTTTTLNTNGGTYATNQVTAAANIFAGWFTSVIAGADDLLPLVVSQRGLFLNPITEITVGIVPDSQRRRRWSQLEAPVSVWSA
jgi:hypothetical protein